MAISKIGHTIESIAAVNTVKNATKKYVYQPVANDIPKEFIQKKQYMQSDEFLNDTQNKKMFSLLDQLMLLRDKITEKIKENNSQNQKEELTQAINGFSRNTIYLKKNNKLQFANYPGFTTADAQYKFAKMKAYNQSRTFLKDIGR